MVGCRSLPTITFWLPLDLPTLLLAFFRPSLHECRFYWNRPLAATTTEVGAFVWSDGTYIHNSLDGQYVAGRWTRITNYASVLFSAPVRGYYYSQYGPVQTWQQHEEAADCNCPLYVS